MQGGHHPDLPLTWYTDLLQWLRQTHPEIELDCFSPSEIDNLCEVENKSAYDILKELRDAGLRGLPGGGAELLDDSSFQKLADLPKETVMRIMIVIARVCILLIGLVKYQTQERNE